MDIDNLGGFTLRVLSKLNVILGKNGCGKSYLLKQVDEHLTGREGFGKIRYISPERGGSLQYEAGVEQAIGQDPNWMVGQRRRNQASNFRQQTTALFRLLEMSVLLEIEREPVRYAPRTFDATVEKLNLLLDRVRLVRDRNRAFRLFDRTTNSEVTAETISSGESELISLGIEFLAFAKDCEPGKNNVLLVDEPDVHLHPDLQDRLGGFIVDAIKDIPMTLILATHSTALLASLANREQTVVAFMQRGDTSLTFKVVSDVDRAILPIFGAHPLSNVFNQAPILLVEGEDDERLWQQAVRSSEGRLRIFPCVVDGEARFAEFETEVNNIIEAVYDDAKGYSLRDRDLHPELIDDVGHVIRMRLGCRSAENLMLSNEVLALAGTDWEALQMTMSRWLGPNVDHQYHADVSEFLNSGYDRKDHDIKSIRNILVGLISNKPWEVLVVQAIARLSKDGGPVTGGSLRDYLGEKVCQKILKLAD